MLGSLSSGNQTNVSPKIFCCFDFGVGKLLEIGICKSVFFFSLKKRGGKKILFFFCTLQKVKTRVGGGGGGMMGGGE